jgi:hypothetical protein
MNDVELRELIDRYRQLKEMGSSGMSVGDLAGW